MHERITASGTIGEHTYVVTRPIPQVVVPRANVLVGHDMEGREVLSRKQVEVVRHADLIDLLLDSDEPTRRLLVFQALQAGTLKKSEAESLMAQVARLERHAGPRTDAGTVSQPQGQAA